MVEEIRDALHCLAAMGLFADFVYEESFHRESLVAQGAMKGGMS